MLNSKLQPLVRRALDPLAAGLVARGVTADAMTFGGFAVGAVAAAALAAGAFRIALVLILLNRVADGLDGALARRLGPTDRGAFLDIASTLDALVYLILGLIGDGLEERKVHYV